MPNDGYVQERFPEERRILPLCSKPVSIIYQQPKVKCRSLVHIKLQGSTNPEYRTAVGVSKQVMLFPWKHLLGAVTFTLNGLSPLEPVPLSLKSIHLLVAPGIAALKQYSLFHTQISTLGSTTKALPKLTIVARGILPTHMNIKIP